MSQANNAIGDFVDAIQGVEDIETLREQFMDSVRKLGIGDFSYHIVRAQGFTEEMVCGIITYPDHWVSHYINEGYVHFDPVIKAGRHSNLPFLWSDMPKNQDMTAPQKKLMQEAADLGILSGITVPIHGHREFAMLSVVPDATVSEGNKILEDSHHILHLLALYFHNHTRGLIVEKMQTDAAPKLTAREAECLKWTAEGKTAWEISQILSISERTVVYYLENAKHKLGVNSRPHAVVKAVMSGLIDFG